MSDLNDTTSPRLPTSGRRIRSSGPAPTRESCESYIVNLEREMTAEELLSVLMLAGRVHGPWLLFVAATMGRASDETIASLIATVWSMAEYPESSLGRREWLHLFGRAGFTIDGRRGERPEQPVRLFRGAPHSRRRRWAWTASREVAEGFAGGLHSREPGEVWTTLAPPQSILCIIGTAGREGEDEYVVNTVGLRITRAEEAG